MAQATTAKMATHPYWADSASVSNFPRLQRKQRVDVVVIGAGITGLTAAHVLLKAGKTVAVLERARCAQIDTGHTSAHLTMVTDERLTDLVSRIGRDHAQAVWDGGLAAIAQIDETTREHEIDCAFEWVDGYLHRALEEGARDRTDFEAEASLAADLGFDATFEHQVPLVGVPGIRFAQQARFHPRKYLAGLARSIADLGGKIYEHSEAGEFCDDPLGVKVGDVMVTCDDIVIATHTPLVGLTDIASATLFQSKLALYTSYVIAGRVATGTIPDALWWDTADPYHYLRLETHRDFDVVIFGGADHKTGQEPNAGDGYAALEETLRALVPRLDITHRWSGQVIETPDGLPYIGQTADHQYAATGFAGNGMTFGTLAAMMMSDAILGRGNPWAELFDPSRKALDLTLWDYFKENADYPYYLIRDRFAGAESRLLRSVKRGHGLIIERDGAKVAAYRNDNGAVTLRSAVCTHMGCVVRWNPAERTWDCPCHGSRFKPGGDVIAGPAEEPLSEL
jgi:glycine/D-amino acid oxidase-like deaminating enzyme/nitrite reductase/ring-hydroxylating ferredoxin subunit